MKISKHEIRIRNILDEASLAIASQDIRVLLYDKATMCNVQPFLFLNGSDELHEFFTAHTRQAPPAYVVEADHITLIGQGLIVDSKGRRLIAGVHEVCRMDLSQNLSLLIDDGKCYRLDPKIRVRDINEDAAILSQAGQGVYGHWLVDILPRMAFLDSIGFQGKFVLYEPLASFQIPLLNQFGIALERIITYQPKQEALQFRRVLIPCASRWKSGFSKMLVPAAVRRLPGQKAMQPQAKLYISRQILKSSSRTIINRQELEAVALSHGFDIIYPERLSIAEQASLFSSAAVVAGEYGSGMHNSIFSSPACKVLVFQSKARFPFIQAGLSNIMGQPVGFVFGETAGDRGTFSINCHDADHAFSRLSHS